MKKISLNLKIEIFLIIILLLFPLITSQSVVRKNKIKLNLNI